MISTSMAGPARQPSRLRSAVLMPCILLSASLLQPSRASAQAPVANPNQRLQENIDPGATLCTRGFGTLTDTRDVRFEVTVLTLPGVPVDPRSKPLVLSMGAPDGHGSIVPEMLLLQVPITPSFLPHFESFLLENAVFGQVLRRRPLGACIMNPEGNPEFRVVVNPVAILAPTMTMTPAPPPARGGGRLPGPVFSNGRVTITCCDANRSGCIAVTTRDDDPLLPQVCPPGLLPVL